MSMIVAGVMSGTSVDGINVALVRLTADTGRARRPSPHKNHQADFTLLAHEEYPFPAPVRRAILEMMNAELAPVADLARLNFLLGELYAEALANAARKHRVQLDLAGCHGQTLYHQVVPQRFLGRKVAVSGRVLDGLVAKIVRALFYQQKPPRTAGREEFGREYVARILQICRGASKSDAVATATALTARTIADSVRRFVLPKFVGRRNRAGHQMIVSGGGAKNPTLMAMLRDEITPLGLSLHFSDEFGLPAEAKEAVAFALLAHETWHRRPSNVPSATGAKRAAILGKIWYA